MADTDMSGAGVEEVTAHICVVGAIRGVPRTVGDAPGVTTEGEHVPMYVEHSDAWHSIQRLLDDVLPEHPSTRELLDDALWELVSEVEKLAVKQHGQQIIDVVFGDRFQLIRDCEETDDQWTRDLPDREDEWRI